MDDSRPVAARDVTQLPAAGPTWRDQLSDQVRRLAEVALGQALDAVTAGPMAPFVVLDRPEGRVLGRFEGEAAGALARARAHVRASDAARAAIGWDGYLTVSGVRQEAVVVEVSERGLPGVVVAHRYRETVEGTVIVGRPVLVGPGAPIL